MNTVAKVVFGSSINGKRRIEGVASYDILYSTSSSLLQELPLCSTVSIKHPIPHVRCFLIDRNGFLLVHPDFLNQNVYTNPDEADPIQNIFIGTKEPDIANALLDAGVIKAFLNMRSPTGTHYYNYYKLDVSMFVDNSVHHGQFNSKLKCLQPNASWSITRIIPRGGRD